MSQEKFYAELKQPDTGYALTIKDVGSLPADCTAMIPTCYSRSTVTDLATIALTITQPIEIIPIDTMAQACLINLTISSELAAGAKIYLKLPSDGTGRTVTLGTGTCTSVITGGNSKTKWALLVYDGTIYNLVSVYQIN